jgi:hypothetical protein
MTDFMTRRRAVHIGLLVGLPVILVSALPAVWSLADQHLSRGGTSWSSRGHAPWVAQGTSVEISGTTKRELRPGASSRINLEFANKGSEAVILRHVRITITGIKAPQADTDHPCAGADFRVVPMRAETFLLPGDGLTSLASLGVPASQWPRITMLNRPVNQDGCKGARLTLDYVGYRAWSK